MRCRKMIPKFRAWDKQEEIMYEVISIDFQTKVIKVYYREVDTKGYKPFSEIILEQSTGLSDKNGREIFEGDIIKLTDDWGDEEYFIVRYAHGCASVFNADDEFDNSLSGYVYWDKYTVEVCGNIHEHKHLLEE